MKVCKFKYVQIFRRRERYVKGFDAGRYAGYFKLRLKVGQRNLHNVLQYSMIILLIFTVIASICRGDLFLDIVKNNIQPVGESPEFTNIAKYDFIVVGAGSAGSAIANRLSENKKWRVLLLEAGYPQNLLNKVPILVGYYQLTDFNWGYKVEPQNNACLGMIDHQCSWPRGRALGGTSTLNYMIHTRGSKQDYDNWASLGNVGWSYADVFPYFKKSERFNIPSIKTTRHQGNSSYHGENGYVCVEYVPCHTKLADAYLEAGRELGYDVVDYNGQNQIGFSYLQVNMDRGARCSAARAYLDTINRANLNIVTGARVTKVLIDGDKRAYGVEYIKDGTLKKVLCTKEVILSAGTIDSAKLLMLSGIGPRDHLEELGIPVIQDSKVGYNMYEHIGFLGLTFLVNQSVSLTQSRITPSVMLEYLLFRDGFMTIPGGAEALAFVRTKYAVDEKPDVELLFVSGSIHSDNGMVMKEVLRITDELYDAVFKPIENQDAWSIWPIVQQPRSIGRLTLRSKDPLKPPKMDPNFFSHPADLEIILEGVKHAINISKTEAFQAYGSRLHDLKIPGCRQFEFASDDYWRCAIKHLPSMMNHEIGTVKMGPQTDAHAVVDPQLRVYGIQRLRVADASIMPVMPTGHVNAGIFMIGEKAADMIKETWYSAE
ncbi:PREDICTED: glucose dehydrogenase [FAD, quinone]-like [Dinoponera quadriceps]|uniref:Glucose dehydrogenase [FAD, quinone]-like n=1 Tax=Dinoponera quadriceps TaxID=609295 RepID=A0A6P3XEX4_DINQU|nr:PREDICTED: glucose dehydrogenase [FAD, quinone]-like [Dinoponera quadriceps]